MQEQDLEIDIYQESGPAWDQAEDIDYEFISKDHTEGICFFHNSNTVHECRFNIISTSSTVEKPPIHLEVILTEQMVQVNDLNTESIYVDELNSSGLIFDDSSNDEPPVYWLYLKTQISPLLISKLDLSRPSNICQILIWIGTSKEANQETTIYKKTLPIFGDNEDAVVGAPLFPLNIRNTSKYSYMNILDIPFIDLPKLDIIPTVENHDKNDDNKLNYISLSLWGKNRRKKSHLMSEHICHILDKSKLPVS